MSCRHVVGGWQNSLKGGSIFTPLRILGPPQLSLHVIHPLFRDRIISFFIALYSKNVPHPQFSGIWLKQEPIIYSICIEQFQTIQYHPDMLALSRRYFCDLSSSMYPAIVLTVSNFTLSNSSLSLASCSASARFSSSVLSSSVTDSNSAMSSPCSAI